MSIEKAKNYLKQFGADSRVLEFDVSSATVELAAQAVGCEPARIAKTMSFRTNDGVILIVAAGDAKVDNPKYKARFGCKAKMLAFEEVEPEIGHAVGGVCPFGVNKNVTVFLDESLRRFETVFPACGSSNSAIELSIPELGRRVQGLAGMTLALAQFGSGTDKGKNLDAIRSFAQKSAKSGVSMLFLPEYSMYYAKTNRRSLNMQAAEPLDGTFVSALGRIARRYGLWLAAGMYEQTDGLPYNTVVVLDDTGMLRGCHRKNKLYDAFGYRESDECRAGSTPFSPIPTPAGILGLITCFELRFPALAAAQRAAGAELLYVPAGWAAGPNKILHWRTLLCARAIENSMTVLGADQYAPGCFIGQSAAFAPDGTLLGALGGDDALLTITI